MAPREAKGTGPMKLWTQEEFGCRLKEDVPSCKSEMAQEDHRHE
jgi:hypothetical protein